MNETKPKLISMWPGRCLVLIIYLLYGKMVSTRQNSKRIRSQVWDSRDFPGPLGNYQLIIELWSDWLWRNPWTNGLRGEGGRWLSGEHGTRRRLGSSSSGTTRSGCSYPLRNGRVLAYVEGCRHGAGLATLAPASALPTMEWERAGTMTPEWSEQRERGW